MSSEGKKLSFDEVQSLELPATPAIPTTPSNSDRSISKEIGSRSSLFRTLVLTVMVGLAGFHSSNTSADEIGASFFDIEIMKSIGEAELFVEIGGDLYRVQLMSFGVNIEKYGAEKQPISRQLFREIMWQLREDKFKKRYYVEDRLEAIDAGRSGRMDHRRASFKNRNGVDVDFNGSPGGLKTEQYPGSDSSRILQEIKEVFDMFPSFMIKGFELKKLHVLRKIQNARNGNEYGGVFTGDTIVSEANRGTIFHELFHMFDAGLIRVRRPKDDYLWVDINPNGSDDYVYQSGDAAISDKGAKKKGGKCYKKRKGFPSRYAYCGGPNEDQAEVAKFLFTASENSDFFRRLKEDKVLRSKVEMMTGCFWDPKSNQFTELMDPLTYRERFGAYGEFKSEELLGGISSEDYQYFPKWSQLLMDHKYWNAVIQGKKVRFKRTGDYTWKLVVGN